MGARAKRGGAELGGRSPALARGPHPNPPPPFGRERGHEGYFRKFSITFRVIFDTLSSMKIEAFQAIEPAEKTFPPDGIS